MLTMVQKKGRGSKAWAERQNKYTEIQLHLLLIIHLEISIQNISLVLSCEPHPKCKPKAIDNCFKRNLRKVNNPCTRKYKHHCFHLVVTTHPLVSCFCRSSYTLGGIKPQSCITLPLGVTIYHLAKLIKNNGEYARITQELKYERRRTKYITHHNHSLIIHQIPANST